MKRYLKNITIKTDATGANGVFSYGGSTTTSNINSDVITVNISDNSAKSITLKLDKTSSIKLTDDWYITSLDNSDSTNSNIDFNGYKLYVNGKEIKSN